MEYGSLEYWILIVQSQIFGGVSFSLDQCKIFGEHMTLDYGSEKKIHEIHRTGMETKQHTQLFFFPIIT